MAVYQAELKLQCNVCLIISKPYSCVHVGRSVQAHYSMDLKCCLDPLSQVLIARIVQHDEGEGLAAALLLAFYTSLKFETKTYVRGLGKLHNHISDIY